MDIGGWVGQKWLKKLDIICGWPLIIFSLFIAVIMPLKGNEEAIRNYGIHMCVEMIRDLFTSGYAPGVHIYTLNREVAATSILKKLGLWRADPSRYLPFKLPANPKRCNEGVRPIFWNKRSRTYVYR